ncbi:MAG: ribosome-binding factor A [bacterium]
MSRIDQINQLLLVQFGEIINREVRLEGGLITVVYVECSKDLRTARVAVSVLPDNMYGTALSVLRKKSKVFSKILQKELKMKFVPRIHWMIDNTEKKAAELEEVFKQAAELDD